MRAGFNWEMGPFEMWDAAGVRDTVARMKAMQIPVSHAVEELLDSKYESLVLAPDGPQCFQSRHRPMGADSARSRAMRASLISAARNGVVRSNAGRFARRSRRRHRLHRTAFPEERASAAMSSR